MRLKMPDVLKIAFQSFMNNVHTCIPGTIESYDPVKKKVSVKPGIKKELDTGSISYPVITDVPVMFPCTKDSIITFPLKKGDGCLILFSETCLERYLSAAGEEVEAGDKRKFALSDAICIPGLFPFGSPGSVGDGINLQVKYKNYEVSIGELGITLKTGDASGWQPNILTTDPMTGIPHGGITGGVIKLKGA